MRKVLLLMLLFVLSINAQANTCNVNGLKYALNHSTNEAVCMGFENEPTDYISISVADYITVADSQYKVIEIGGGAFFNCHYLQSIELPSTLSKISFLAFAKCSNLENIVFPENLKVIEREAFALCTSLTSLYIPENVEELGSTHAPNVFLACSNLKSIKVSSKNAVFDSRKNCNAIIETSTNKIITGCSTSTIVNGVEAIGYRAFKQMLDLYELKISSTVHTIEPTAFDGCPNINYITVSKHNAVYDSRENCNAIIETATNTLCIGSNKTIIPDGIDTIGACAFCGRTGLFNIAIPNSVKVIREFAFESCIYLNSIILPVELTKIYPSAFQNCIALSDVVFNENIERIFESAFKNCILLQEVVLPNSITHIDFNAFEGCKALTLLKLPDNDMCHILDNAFLGCSSIVELTIPFGVQHVGKNAFAYCSGIENVHVKNSETEISDSAFDSTVIINNM